VDLKDTGWEGVQWMDVARDVDRGWEGVHWMDVARDVDKWRAFVNSRFSYNAENFFTSGVTINLSRSTLLREVRRHNISSMLACSNRMLCFTSGMNPDQILGRICQYD
jgi:hypothetical protein